MPGPRRRWQSAQVALDFAPICARAPIGILVLCLGNGSRERGRSGARRGLRQAADAIAAVADGGLDEALTLGAALATCVGGERRPPELTGAGRDRSARPERRRPAPEQDALACLDAARLDLAISDPALDAASNGREPADAVRRIARGTPVLPAADWGAGVDDRETERRGIGGVGANVRHARSARRSRRGAVHEPSCTYTPDSDRGRGRIST